MSWNEYLVLWMDRKGIDDDAGVTYEMIAEARSGYLNYISDENMRTVATPGGSLGSAAMGLMPRLDGDQPQASSAHFEDQQGQGQGKRLRLGKVVNPGSPSLKGMRNPDAVRASVEEVRELIRTMKPPERHVSIPVTREGVEGLSPLKQVVLTSSGDLGKVLKPPETLRSFAFISNIGHADVEQCVVNSRERIAILGHYPPVAAAARDSVDEPPALGRVKFLLCFEEFRSCFLHALSSGIHARNLSALFNLGSSNLVFGCIRAACGSQSLRIKSTLRLLGFCVFLHDLSRAFAMCKTIAAPINLTVFVEVVLVVALKSLQAIQTSLEAVPFSCVAALLKRVTRFGEFDSELFDRRLETSHAGFVCCLLLRQSVQQLLY